VAQFEERSEFEGGSLHTLHRTKKGYKDACYRETILKHDEKRKKEKNIAMFSK
jgi:hypothetical protein